MFKKFFHQFASPKTFYFVSQKIFPYLFWLSIVSLIIGLICVLCREAALETAKKILLAYIIGTSILMYMFFAVFANEPLMNFGVEMVIPDIIIYIGAIFGYFKAK